jgi:hypothetical protein
VVFRSVLIEICTDFHNTDTFQIYRHYRNFLSFFYPFNNRCRYRYQIPVCIKIYLLECQAYF